MSVSPQSAPTGHKNVPVVLAADENYAMPLATALRSLVDSNKNHWPLDVHVLTDGFSESTKARVIESLPPTSADVRWVQIDLTTYGGLAVMSHVSRVTFARLQIPDIFDDSVARVLYLDTDILVLGDLEALWHAEMGDAPIGAVRDFHVDANLKAGRADRVVGVPRVKDYFNAGVLLMDLQACRRSHVFQAAREYLRAHPQTPYSDQDALNVACDGVWHELQPKWNFQNHHNTRVARELPAKRPVIVHFITSCKPWISSSTSINESLFNEFRSRTSFGLSPWARTRFLADIFFHRIKNRFDRYTTRLTGG